MISLETFKKRIYVLKWHYKDIEEKFDKALNGLRAVIDDVYGVPASWIYDILKAEFFNICLAVKEEITDLNLEDLFNFYVLENQFNGMIEWEENEKKIKYDLSDDEQLYDYIKNLE